MSRFATLAALGLGLLIVLVATFYPFDVSFKCAVLRSHLGFSALVWGKTDASDVMKNILLFVPLGFGLSGLLMKKRGRSRRWLVSVVFLSSFALSGTIEILQIFMPSRFPSLADVLANSAGGLLGFLCFRLWLWMCGNPLFSMVAYAALTFLISIHLQRSTSLSNWDNTFPLLVGNEQTGDRPWRGCISEFYIANKALLPAEVSDIASKRRPIPSLGNSLLAWYQWTGRGSYRDAIHKLPVLIWNGQAERGQGRGMLLGPENWLETAGPAAYVTQRIARTSQFTLGVTMAPEEIYQTGPARLVSVSVDPFRRNLTLGHEGRSLVVRLRTPETGENGMNPELTVPEIFNTRDIRNLMITYDGSTLSVYVDGRLNAHSLELSPGPIAVDKLFSPMVVNVKLSRLLYYAVIFLPLGILSSVSLRGSGSNFQLRSLAVAGAVLISPFILESLLAGVSGRNAKLENLLPGFVFVSIAMLLTSLRPRWDASSCERNERLLSEKT